MAVRYFCDGCDEEILYNKEDSSVNIEVNGNTTNYNLCKSCIDSRLQPKKWVRPPKAGPR